MFLLSRRAFWVNANCLHHQLFDYSIKLLLFSADSLDPFIPLLSSFRNKSNAFDQSPYQSQETLCFQHFQSSSY